MSRKGAKLPTGSENKMIIICTEEQEKHIRQCGCIACDDDICDCAFCGARNGCAYDADNVKYKRPYGSVVYGSMKEIEYVRFKSVLTHLKDLAVSVRYNEDSVFADERNVAEYDTREIIDTLVGLEL